MCNVCVQHKDTNDNKAWLCNKYLVKQRRNKSASPLLNQSRTIDTTTHQLKLIDIQLKAYISQHLPTHQAHNCSALDSEPDKDKSTTSAYRYYT